MTLVLAVPRWANELLAWVWLEKANSGSPRAKGTEPERNLETQAVGKRGLEVNWPKTHSTRDPGIESLREIRGIESNLPFFNTALVG